MGARQFGARVPRVEDPALLTGRARFVDDLKLPGMLHAAFVRSPHAHARIGTIGTAAALAIPGVHAVFTARDMPGRLATERLPMPVPNAAIAVPRTQHALARGEVCYVGEAVAVVIADDRYLAEDAAAAVAIDYEMLPAISDCRDALAAAPRSHSDLATNVAAFIPMAYGDVDHAFATAAHVFEEQIFQHRGGAMTLEGRAVLASQTRRPAP
jgi:carbon-monoxide dehydrogenase large subunit